MHEQKVTTLRLRKLEKKDEKGWGLYLATEKTIGWYTDLARAKSEALDKIYGLF